MKKSFLLAGALTMGMAAVVFLSCNKTQSVSQAQVPEVGNIKSSLSGNGTGGTLVFSSGLEVLTSTNPPRVSGNSNSSTLANIVGNSAVTKSDWGYDIKNPGSSKWHDNRLNYGTDGGNLYDRVAKTGNHLAEVIDNPVKITGNTSDKVLNFILNGASEFNPGCSTPNNNKTRVQEEITSYTINGNPNASDVRQYYQTIKFYLPADFSVLQNSTFPSTCEWLTLFEFHDKKAITAMNTNEYDYRMSVYLDQNTTGGLVFRARGDYGAGNNSIPFNTQGTGFVIPLGKWIEVELYIKEGDNTTGANGGRFYMAARNLTDSGAWTKVVDIKNYTRNPDNTSPTGLTDFSPMKFYCPASVVQRFTNATPRKLMQIYWDDLEIYEDRVPTFLP